MSDLKLMVGEQIKLIRNSKKWNQDKLAEMASKHATKKDAAYNKSWISRIENGHENITLETIELLMRALDVSAFEFFDFIKHKAPADFHNKEEILDAHKYMLLERPLDEIAYVVRQAKDFLDTVDSKKEHKQ